MKKLFVLLFAALTAALLLSACRAGEPEPAAVLTGTVLDVYENGLLVRPDQGDAASRSGDQFSVGLAEGASVLDEEGQPLALDGGGLWLFDRVEVGYNGEVMESYPCQITASSVKRLPKEQLTMEALLALAEEKGSALTWVDFAPYEAVETGFGLYILVFEMADNYRVWVGGSPVEDPMYIYLQRGGRDSGERIEIREGGIWDFVDGTAQAGASGDYPAALMAEGQIYLLGQPMPAEVAESAVIGRTTSYTDGWPARDGETNFSRALDLPYARVEGGIAILYENEWHFCEAAK